MTIGRRLFVALAVLLFLPGGLSPDDPRKVDAIRIPPGETVIRISDPEAVPAQIRRAIPCNYTRSIAVLPIVIIRPHPDAGMFAIAHCDGVITKPVFLGLVGGRAPRELFLPFPAAPRGFVADRPPPGVAEWNEADESLVLATSTDLCPSPAGRFTYRYERRSGADNPFVLVQVELAENSCANERNWKVVWQAETWSWWPSGK